LPEQHSVRHLLGAEHANRDGQNERRDINQPCLCVYGTHGVEPWGLAASMVRPGNGRSVEAVARRQSKRLVARDLFDPANAEVTFTISSNDLPSPSRPAGGRTFRGACRRLINVSPVLRYNALPLAKRC